MLIAGYAFLYAPIAFLVVFSFNDSRLVTTWTGASTRWYVALFQNQTLIDAALLSLRVAAVSATIATVIGTWPGSPSPGSGTSPPEDHSRRPSLPPS